MRPLECAEALSHGVESWNSFRKSREDIAGKPVRPVFRGVDFSGIKKGNLKKALLSNALIYRCTFDGLYMHGSDLSNTIIADSSFNSVEAESIKLNHSTLMRVEAEKAVMPGAEVGGSILCSVKLNGARVHLSNFGGSKFFGGSARGACFTDADMPFTLFVDFDMSGADLTNAVLNDSTCIKVKASGAVLHNAVLEYSTFLYMNSAAAVMTGINAHGLSSILSGFEKADFTGASIPKSEFLLCSLLNAAAKDADIEGADFTGSLLSPKRMNEAKGLSSASLYETVMDPAGGPTCMRCRHFTTEKCWQCRRYMSERKDMWERAAVKLLTEEE